MMPGRPKYFMEAVYRSIIKGKKVAAYECALKVKDFVQKTYHYTLNNEDLLYMTIHIARIADAN